MKLTFDSSVAEFLEKASPDLRADAQVNSMILSLAAKYVGKPVNFLVRGCDENGRQLIAGLQTESGYALILPRTSAENARALALALAKTERKFPGVSGPLPACEAFAEAWSSSKKCPAKLNTSLRLFKLEKLNPPLGISGSCRPASAKDESLIFKWLREFHAEAVPHDPHLPDEVLAREIRDSTAKEQYFVWEDGGRLVCLVGSKRETESERWIAPVYTPVEFRGRGYGSALTAAVSARILAGGKIGMLFTNQANPISNSIYQKIGYIPITDFQHFVFE